MSLYNGPPRGGSRGGKDQFNWEDVKNDKFREYYLGASLKANVGRWQKNRDVFWYTREKADQDSAIEDEVAAVKAREEDMMLEALGMKPRQRKPVEMKARLDANEMKNLLQRGGPDDAQEGDAPKAVADEDEDAIRGLGFASAAMRAAPSALAESTERMEGTGVIPPPPPPDGGGGAPRSGISGSLRPGGGSHGGSETLRSLQKLKRKAEKRAKKEAKKAKKKSKKSKEKKTHKESRRGRHDSSDDDSDSGSDRSGGRPLVKDRRGGRGQADAAAGLGHHSRRMFEEDRREPVGEDQRRRRHDSDGERDDQPYARRDHQDRDESRRRDNRAGRSRSRSPPPPHHRHHPRDGREDRREYQPRRRHDSPPPHHGRAGRSRSPHRGRRY